MKDKIKFYFDATLKFNSSRSNSIAYIKKIIWMHDFMKPVQELQNGTLSIHKREYCRKKLN